MHWLLILNLIRIRWSWLVALAAHLRVLLNVIILERFGLIILDMNSQRIILLVTLYLLKILCIVCLSNLLIYIILLALKVGLPTHGYGVSCIRLTIIYLEFLFMLVQGKLRWSYKKAG